MAARRPDKSWSWARVLVPVVVALLAALGTLGAAWLTRTDPGPALAEHETRIRAVETWQAGWDGKVAGWKAAKARNRGED